MYLKLGCVDFILSGAIGNVPELSLQLFNVSSLDVQQLCILLQTPLVLTPHIPQLGLEGLHLPIAINVP